MARRMRNSISCCWMLILSSRMIVIAAAFVIPPPPLSTARRVTTSSSPSTTTTVASMVKLPKFLQREKKKDADVADGIGETTTTTTSTAQVQEKDAVNDDNDDDEKANLMSKIKAAGVAGAISLFLWEAAFWAISIPVAIFGFTTLNGSFPDFSNPEDVAKVTAEAFAFANLARFALPIRIGLAVSTTPWVQENIVDSPWMQEKFFKNKDDDKKEDEGAL